MILFCFSLVSCRRRLYSSSEYRKHFNYEGMQKNINVSLINNLKANKTQACVPGPSSLLMPSAHRGLMQWAAVTSLSLTVIQSILPALSSAPTCCQQLLLRKPSCQTKAQPSQTQITDCPMLALVFLMLANNPHRVFLD